MKNNSFFHKKRDSQFKNSTFYFIRISFKCQTNKISKYPYSAKKIIFSIIVTVRLRIYKYNTVCSWLVRERVQHSAGFFMWVELLGRNFVFSFILLNSFGVVLLLPTWKWANWFQFNTNILLHSSHQRHRSVQLRSLGVVYYGSFHAASECYCANLDLFLWIVCYSPPHPEEDLHMLAPTEINSVYNLKVLHMIPYDTYIKFYRSKKNQKTWLWKN